MINKNYRKIWGDFFSKVVGESNKSGFTLIELLAVMFIIALLSATTIANYHYGSRQITLDMQVNLLAQDLRRTQEWALAAHEINGVAMHGYGIYAVPGDNHYIIFLDNGSDGGSILPGNGQYDDGYDVVQEMIILDKNIEIASATPNPATVDYMVPDPTTRIGGSSLINEQRIGLRLKGGTVVRTVVVNKAGLVYVE